MNFEPVPNHPECRRSFLGVLGPSESRSRIIITKERDGRHEYRVKYAGERHYVPIGHVRTTRDPIKEARIWHKIRDIL